MKPYSALLYCTFSTKDSGAHGFFGVGLAYVPRVSIGAHRAPRNFQAVMHDKPLVEKV